MFADPIDHAVLQDPEQIGLQIERHLSDLVQTEHPATRLLDFAGASMLVRAGKGALGVSEKLACNEIMRDSAAIHRHEGALGIRAGAFDRAGEQLFANPVSPSMRIESVLAANLRARSRASRIAALSPRIWSNPTDGFETVPSAGAGRRLRLRGRTTTQPIAWPSFLTTSRLAFGNCCRNPFAQRASGVVRTTARIASGSV